jgi:hypothetical protein
MAGTPRLTGFSGFWKRKDISAGCELGFAIATPVFTGPSTSTKIVVPLTNLVVGKAASDTRLLF